MSYIYIYLYIYICLDWTLNRTWMFIKKNQKITKSEKSFSFCSKQHIVLTGRLFGRRA